jgi:hypothetical protein
LSQVQPDALQDPDLFHVLQCVVVSSVRVLIASSLAEVIAPRLAEEFDATTVASAHELEAFVNGLQTVPDVCLLDLLWHTAQDEWTFDGLDVTAELDTLDPSPRLLVALFGHSSEADHLDEIAQHSRYRGAILKGDLGNLIRSIDDVGKRKTVAGHDLPYVPREPRATLAYAFSKSKRLAAVAGAIASAHSERWEDVATLTAYTSSTVEKSLDEFAGLLTRRGEVPVDGRVTVQVLYRWVGEHSRYIVSWCRRNGYPQFARRL